MTLFSVAETPDTRATWMEMESEALGRAYSPSSTAPNFVDTLNAYQGRSDLARKQLGEGETLRYGTAERNVVRLFEAVGAAAPLLVFFHGGYWQEGSADASLFPALELVGRGTSYAAIGYTLAPHASLGAIVEQCATGLAHLARLYRTRHPGARMVLAGSSAGAHLAAMMMTVDWREHDFKAPPFSSAVLLSGVYDLRPLVPTYINEALKLDTAQALQCSPLFLAMPAAVPCTIGWGEREPPEFRQQSERLSRRLKEVGVDATLFEVAGRDHFDIVFDLSAADTAVGGEVLARLEK